MTSSFDRKVKLWDSATGQFIDSLQQNYNKTLPEPLAYFDLKKNYLYTKDRKKAFETEPLAALSSLQRQRMRRPCRLSPLTLQSLGRFPRVEGHPAQHRMGG